MDYGGFRSQTTMTSFLYTCKEVLIREVSLYTCTQKKVTGHHRMLLFFWIVYFHVEISAIISNMMWIKRPPKKQRYKR